VESQLLQGRRRKHKFVGGCPRGAQGEDFSEGRCHRDRIQIRSMSSVGELWDPKDVIADAPLKSEMWHIRTIVKCLRDFCVSRLCFVMLSHARLWISNGHPASVVVRNQLLAIERNLISTARRASNQVVGGSSPSGRSIQI
jgi:hypothetical protein